MGTGMMEGKRKLGHINSFFSFQSFFTHQSAKDSVDRIYVSRSETETVGLFLCFFPAVLLRTKYIFMCKLGTMSCVISVILHVS